MIRVMKESELPAGEDWLRIYFDPAIDDGNDGVDWSCVQVLTISVMHYKQDIKELNLSDGDFDELIPILDDDHLIILNSKHEIYGETLRYILTNKIKYYMIVYL